MSLPLLDFNSSQLEVLERLKELRSNKEVIKQHEEQLLNHASLTNFLEEMNFPSENLSESEIMSFFQIARARTPEPTNFE